jgi:hypothetical protein
LLFAARPFEWRLRCRRSRIRDVELSVACVLARLGETVLVALLLVLLVSAPAGAAQGGVAPDPAPQASSPASGGISPAADPAPQAATPVPSGGGSLAIAPSRLAGPSPLGTGAHSGRRISPIRLPASLVRGSARASWSSTTRPPGSDRHSAPVHQRTAPRHAALSLAVASGSALALVAARRSELLPTPITATVRLPPARGDGVLLLLSALALAVLVVASGAMLRLLRRLGDA